MKVIDIINYLKDGAIQVENSCDTVKFGDVNKKVKKVAVTMMATAEVITKAIDLGVDMLITHEPTYYQHMDDFADLPVTNLKRKLLEDSKITLYRCHDNMHYRFPDQITLGELEYLGLKGKMEKTPYFASYLFTAETPITAKELVNKIKKVLKVKHVKIAGELDKKSTKLALCFGTPSGMYELLSSNDVEILITGEACEWQLAEYARDAKFFGLNKSLIVMGHIGSERDGMRLLSINLSKKFQNITFTYIECGEVYI